MTLDEFRKTLIDEDAPAVLSPLLRAMWEDAKGNWNEAHAIAQNIDTREGSWIHGYLHRREGDLANAGYWYRRAGQTVPQGTLDEEWTRIVSALLAGSL